MWNHFAEGKDGVREASDFEISGKVSQSETLQYALSTGKGLPFGIQHIRTDGRRQRVSQNLRDKGLKLYKFEVEESIKSMPAKFKNDINDFNYEKLESLTIMLNLGFWQSKITEKEESKELNFENDILEASDHPITILKRQIGTASDETSLTREVVKSVSGIGDESRSLVLGPLVVPTVQSGIRRDFECNTNIVDMSAAIDVWHALNRGKSLEELQNLEIDFPDERDRQRKLEKLVWH